jgi:hypothetical protein
VEIMTWASSSHARSAKRLLRDDGSSIMRVALRWAPFA